MVELKYVIIRGLVNENVHKASTFMIEPKYYIFIAVLYHDLFYVYHVYVTATENVHWLSVEFLLLNKT